MPTKEEWKERIRKEVLGEFAHLEDYSRRTPADRFSDEVAALPNESEDRKAFFNAAIDLLRESVTQQKAVDLLVYVFEGVDSHDAATLDQLRKLTIDEGLPSNDHSRGYVLRTLVHFGGQIDWNAYEPTENWKAIVWAAPLLAADILVHADRYDLAEAVVRDAQRAGQATQADVNEMFDRWRQLVALYNRPLEPFEAFGRRARTS